VLIIIVVIIILCKILCFVDLHLDNLCNENQLDALFILNFGFGGLVVSMLASGTQDRGFEPGRSRLIFRAKKSTTCLPSEGK
jgi:hypothetical protein